MEANEAIWDRILRAIIGVVALYMFYITPVADILKWIYLLIGVIGLFTAAVGHCLLYKLLGISTKKKAKKAEPKPEVRAKEIKKKEYYASKGKEKSAAVVLKKAKKKAKKK